MQSIRAIGKPKYYHLQATYPNQINEKIFDYNSKQNVLTKTQLVDCLHNFDLI